MVEINNQRGRSSICWRGRRELITDVRKRQKSWLWRHCRRRAGLQTSDHPRKLVTLNPKLKSTGAGRYQLLSRWWDAYRKQLGLKDFSPKSQDAQRRPAADKGVALYLWLIVVISVRQSTVAAIYGLHCRALVAGQFEHKADEADCKIQRSGRNGQRDWCMSRVAAIISASVIPILVITVAGCNHYVDNAYHQKRLTIPENWSWRTAAITDMQMRQRDVAALDAIHEGVSWC